MQPNYVKQPPKDFKPTMDYKSKLIERAQHSKEDSIRIQSSGRDSVLLTINRKDYSKMTDDQIKVEITKWREWLYREIYSDDIYKQTHVQSHLAFSSFWLEVISTDGDFLV